MSTFSEIRERRRVETGPRVEANPAGMLRPLEDYLRRERLRVAARAEMCGQFALSLDGTHLCVDVALCHWKARTCVIGWHTLACHCGQLADVGSLICVANALSPGPPHHNIPCTPPQFARPSAALPFRRSARAEQAARPGLLSLGHGRCTVPVGRILLRRGRPQHGRARLNGRQQPSAADKQHPITSCS